MRKRNGLLRQACKNIVSIGVFIILGAISAQQANATDSDAIAPGHLNAAFESVLGQSSEIPYDRALELINTYATSGNSFGLRAAAVIWRTQGNNPAHRTSHVNAYFGVRNLLVKSPGSELREILIDRDELAQLFSNPDPVIGFEFHESKDPMTDEYSCNLRTPRIRGVGIEFDNTGAFISLAIDTDSLRFARFGVRVDGRQQLSGREPQEVTELKAREKAVFRTVSSGAISLQEGQVLLQKATSQFQAVQKVYVAERGSSELERLLREMAIGNSAKVRVVNTDGRDLIVDVPLVVSDASLPIPLNLFDLFGYLYVTCMYGTL